MSHPKSDVLIISVPELEKAARKALDQATMHRDLSKNYSLRIPSALRVGTLDELVALSDELAKTDAFVESISYKLAQYTYELKSGQQDEQEPLTVNGHPIQEYVHNFEWDKARFSTTLSIREISEMIHKQASQTESQMKSRLQTYNKTKGALQAIERKATGSLLVRSLDGVVKPENFVQNSEFLVTLVVAVPKFASKEWEAKYSILDEYVVPNSSELIASDSEFDLWTVTLFRRSVEHFKSQAREHKFVVRDFEFSETSLEETARERESLQSEITTTFAALRNWCQRSFGETFVASMHIKALRVFVESVLRYGLPPKFSAVIIELKSASNMKKVRQALLQLYGHLDSTASMKSTDKVEIAGFGSQEYFPYVSFDFSLGQYTSQHK